MAKIHVLPMGTLHPVRPVVLVPAEPVHKVIFSPRQDFMPKAEASRWSSTGERIYGDAVAVIRRASRMARAPRFMGYGRPAQNNAGQP